MSIIPVLPGLERASHGHHARSHLERTKWDNYLGIITIFEQPSGQNIMLNTHLLSGNTEVSDYETPLCTTIVVETQGIICGSGDVTEPVTEIDGLW